MSTFWKNHTTLKKYPLLLEAMASSEQGLQANEEQKVFTGILAAWRMKKDIFSSQFISFTEVKSMIILGVELYNKETGLLEQTDYTSGKDLCLLEALSHFEDVLKQTGSHQLQQKAHFMWLEPDGTVKTADAERDFEFLDDNIVQSTTVSAPRAQNKNTTIVLYGRAPAQGEVADYSYMDNPAKNNMVKTMLPVSGEVLFHDDYKIQEVRFDEGNAPVLQLLLTTGMDPVVYAKDYKKAFRIDGQKVYFDFDTDWGVNLDLHRFHVSSNVKLYLTFKVTVTFEDIPYTLSIVAKSRNAAEENDTPTTAIIEPISIRWGCLGKDTFITMADGSQKKITDIHIGDLVKTPDGHSAVRDIYKGPEEAMVCVETASGKKLLLTASHPVQTSRGMQKAGELYADDKLLTEQGQYEGLTMLYLQSYQDMVYNLLLEEEHSFYANGIWTGDFELQNSAGKEPEIKWSAKVCELREAMQSLANDLTQACPHHS